MSPSVYRTAIASLRNEVILCKGRRVLCKGRRVLCKGSRVLCKGSRVFHCAATHARQGSGTPETPYDKYSTLINLLKGFWYK